MPLLSGRDFKIWRAEGNPASFLKMPDFNHYPACGTDARGVVLSAAAQPTAGRGMLGCAAMTVL
jgi:hypothetical protein